MDALIDGIKVPNSLLGQLHETNLSKSNNNELKSNLEKDGYLFLRNVIEENKIEEARNDVFKKLSEVDELADPFNEGIASGRSKRDQLFNDRGQFWENVSATKSLRKITNGKSLENILTRIFATPSVGFDFIFLRAVAGGKFTHMHCDDGFFTRKTQKVLTCWLVFTDVTLDKGPLFIIEGSHKFKDIQQKYHGFDVDIHRNKKATIDTHPVDFVKEKNTRILSAEFKPGDALIFGMYTVHGTFENHAKDNRIRLTCDIRFQPKSEPQDPRYFGVEPGGTTGAGYGELNSARPLNEDWHIR
jgi:ectoine hydroxylase-related dioxygenase (phytanoyl-CoA dioxygenase family)